jgi:hypothetical protein
LRGGREDDDARLEEAAFFAGSRVAVAADSTGLLVSAFAAAGVEALAADFLADAFFDDAGAGAAVDVEGSPGAVVSSFVTGAVEVEDPLWSFAFVAASANTPALPYRVGQTLEGKTVSSIGWRPGIGAYVVLREGVTRCYYAQFMPPHPTAPPHPQQQQPRHLPLADPRANSRPRSIRASSAVATTSSRCAVRWSIASSRIRPS